MGNTTTGSRGMGLGREGWGGGVGRGDGRGDGVGGMDTGGMGCMGGRVWGDLGRICKRE